MANMISTSLQQFYNDYAEWLRDGAPVKNDMSFSRRHGLCYSLRFHWGMDNISTAEERDAVESELHKQFAEAGLNPNYPFNDDSFNDDSSSDFYVEVYNKKCHLNEKRRQWVFDHSTIVA